MTSYETMHLDSSLGHSINSMQKCLCRNSHKNDTVQLMILWAYIIDLKTSSNTTFRHSWVNYFGSTLKSCLKQVLH